MKKQNEIEGGDRFMPKMIPIESLRACAYCNDYPKMDPVVLSLDEGEEVVTYTYNCGSCYNKNVITFKVQKVEVFDQEGLLFKSEEVEDIPDYKLLVTPEEFNYCPKCGYSCDWGASEETNEKFIYHCPKCDKSWEFSR